MGGGELRRGRSPLNRPKLAKLWSCRKQADEITFTSLSPTQNAACKHS